MIRVLSNNAWVVTEVGGVQVTLFAWDELARVEARDLVRTSDAGHSPGHKDLFACY